MVDLLRTGVLAAARSSTLEKAIRRAPVSSAVVRRFVAGDDLDAAVSASRDLVSRGLAVSLDHLGEDTTDPAQAERAVTAYLELLRALAESELTPTVEVSVKLSALGLGLDNEAMREQALRIVTAAREAGTTVTIDMEDHTRTEETLATVEFLRQSEPSVGAVIQAYLKRSEGDCEALATPGSRVRLCKGAYREPASVALQSRTDVSASYRRCLRVLMAGDGRPMVATHDPDLLRATELMAAEFGRTTESYELQMLLGVRPAEQARLVGLGHTVRVYVPYGDQWYGYLMRRLAERPANLAFFARALATRG